MLSGTRKKTLGILIASVLKFEDMISKVCQAGYSQQSQLRNLRSVSWKDEKLLLVKSLILIKTDYCSFLYAKAKLKRLKPLHKLLNVAVRFIFGLRKSTPVTRFMAESHILPFTFRINYKFCYYMYKMIHTPTPRQVTLCSVLPTSATQKRSTLCI